MEIMTFEEKQKMTHEDLLTLVAELQEHVLILSSNVKQLKHITGWSSGYDDNNWPVEKSLTKRVNDFDAKIKILNDSICKIDTIEVLEKKLQVINKPKDW
jgi:hypothetical protein